MCALPNIAYRRLRLRRRRSVSEVSVDFADEVPLVSFTCLMFLRAVMYEAMPLDVEYAIVLDNDLREWCSC